VGQVDIAIARATLTAYLGQVAEARDTLAALDGSGAAPESRSPDFGMVRHTIQLLGGEVAESLATTRATYEALRSGAIGALHPEIHLINAVTALVELGRFDEAEAVITPVYDDAAAAHLDTVHRWGAIAGGRLEVRRWAAIARGHLELSRAQLRSAERWFREAAEPGETPVLPRAHRLALAGVAVSAGQRRDASTAAAAVAELDAIPGDPRAAWDIDYDRARAWAAAAAGALPVACEALLTAAERARRTGRWLLELRALHDLLRLGSAPADRPPADRPPADRPPADRPPADRLAELAAAVRTPLATLAAAHAAAVRDADPAALERVADRYADAGYPLFGAEAAETAAGLYRRQEQRRRAIACHNRSMVLRARCEDPATPTLATSVAAEPLSRREHEIALLVAAGETNKAISERLFLSVRTIENHVQRVLGKLGCARRSEIAAALGLTATPRE
jgi:DNA-binding NarL/FixJ family response regulator